MKILEKQTSTKLRNDCKNKIPKNVGKRFLLNSKNFFAFFIIQFVFLSVANLFFIKYNVDADSAILFDHAIEMFSKKTFLLEGWQNTTTLEIDSSLFLAVFIYGITKNIYISFGLSNIIISLLYVWTIYILARNIHLKRSYTYIILILLFIPYRIGQLDYFNMLFFVGGQYGMKVIIPLMLLAITTLPNKIKEKKFLFFECIYYWLLFLSSLSSGVYVFICGVLPIMICEIFYNIKNKCMTNKLRVFCISVIISGIGIIFSKLLASDTKSFEMILTDIYNFKDNLFECLLGIFEVFKAIPYGKTSVLSVAGVLFVCRFIFVCLFLYSIIFYLRRIKYNLKCVNCILTICLWNIFILILTYTNYGSKTFEYRYHLIWIIPAFILLVLRLRDILKKNDVSVGMVISLCFFGLIGLIDLHSCYVLATNYNNYDALHTITKKVEELNPDGTVISLGNEFHEIQDNHILRLIGQKNDYLFVKSNSNEMRLFNNYKKFLDNAAYSERNVVLATAKEMEKMPSYIKNMYELKDKHYIYNIYTSNTNKFDYVSGFTESNVTRDFPYSPGYTYYNSAINENGELVTRGIEGVVLKSPVMEVKHDGVYDIKLNYMYDDYEEISIGKFDLYLDDVLLYSEDINPKNSNVVLNDICLSKENSNVSLEVFNNKNVKMVLKSIEIYSENV